MRDTQELSGFIACLRCNPRDSDVNASRVPGAHDRSETKPYAQEGKYEFFKTSSHFDSTAKHADWLGEDSDLLQQLAPPAG
jgi:hypothetical protein